MAWLLEHWAELCEGLLALYGAIAIIVKITPTKKDDKVLQILKPALDKLEAVTKKVETAANSNNNGQPQ
jgi:hypothetical protein|tara:strand:- start:145 stop:351 length:207 start_codon:yes stop_codon:yes gene_type:complete